VRAMSNALLARLIARAVNDQRALLFSSIQRE
jgi:hypothetical protein